MGAETDSDPGALSITAQAFQSILYLRSLKHTAYVPVALSIHQSPSNYLLSGVVLQNPAVSTGPPGKCSSEHAAWSSRQQDDMKGDLK